MEGKIRGLGLVYGSGNQIRAWKSGMDRPEVLAARNDAPLQGSYVTALTYANGRLFDAGYGGVVRDTLAGEQIGERQSGPICGLDTFQGRLIAAAHVENTCLIRGDGWGRIGGARVYDVETNGTIAQLGRRTWWRQGEKGLLPRDLDCRNTSLDLAVVGDTIYVASQNVVAIRRREKTQNWRTRLRDAADLFPGGVMRSVLEDFALGGEEHYEVQPVIGQRADGVRLASNGKTTYALSYMNTETHPNGAEIQELPSGECVGTWFPSERCVPPRSTLLNVYVGPLRRPFDSSLSPFLPPPGSPVLLMSAEPLYDPADFDRVIGSGRMATVADDGSLILGTVNYDTGERSMHMMSPVLDFYPLTFLRNAFEETHHLRNAGNPIVAIPEEALGRILRV